MKLYQVLMSMLLGMHLCNAHVPRLVDVATEENPYVVNDPEISQAFYGYLDGAPQYFKIVNPEPFLLYVNVLVPEAMGARIDYVADIMHDAELVATLKDGEWKHFYERFAGDSYIRGPEFERCMKPGAYVIKVSNEDNLGYYILAIGKKESFTPREIINLYRLLPSIKEEFFQKSWLTAYWNLFTLLLVLLVLLIAWLLKWLISKLVRFIKLYI